MKKFTLFLFATLFSALSFAALNPYAYGLSSSLNADQTELTVNYSLNATATNVDFVLLDGDKVIKTVNLNNKGLVKGSYTATIALDDPNMPLGKKLSWKIEVKGAAHNTTNNHGGYQFYHPSGVDVDNNPESPHFGRIICNEAMNSVKSKTDTYLSAGFGAGIFAFNAAFEPIANGDKPGFNGGNDFVNTHSLYGSKAQTAYVTRRISISDDGRIFVTSLNPTQDAYLWEVNPDNLDEWTPVFEYTKKSSYYDLVDASGNFIAGPNVGFDVRGSGSDLKLLMLSANINGMQANQNYFTCSEYNLGENKKWNSTPSKEIKFKQKYAISFTGCQVQYDNEGGIWFTQNRGTSTDAQPALVHINALGVEDYKEKIDNLKNAGFCFNKDFTKVIIADGRNTAGTARYDGYARIYDVSKSAEGTPVLTLWKYISMVDMGASLNDFAWDIADNVYAVSNSGEWIRAYALARTADDIAATPCASKYAFTINSAAQAAKASELNPYAYDLSSELSSDKKTLTIHYKLNANAKAVSAVIMNGETEVKSFACTGITRGEHSVAIPTAELPVGLKLTWKIKVDGTSKTKPTQVSTYYSLYCPHGLAIDKNPESEYFGRILAAEGMDAVPASGYLSSGQGGGLYVFNPDFSTDGKVRNGGKDFTRQWASYGYQPWRVKISEDGRIFVSSCDLNGKFVWELSKDLNTWTDVLARGQEKSSSTMKGNAFTTDEGQFLAGMNLSMDVIGSGKDLKLLLYSASGTGITGQTQTLFRLDEYALGEATKWDNSKEPTQITCFSGKYGFMYSNVNIIYDGEGGYWFGASRGGNANQPNLVHFDKDGKRDYYSESAEYYGGDGILLHNGMLIKGKARTDANTGNFGVYTMSKDANGNLVLTEKWSVKANHIGRNLNEFAMDYGENLYVVGNSGEKIIAFAMPYSGSVTTPCAAKYAFELEARGVVKRAVQLGESTIVLTHDADGTPYLYNVVGDVMTPISQNGIVARDPENKGDYLSISDIAVTTDGKLVACNYVRCQYGEEQVDDGYKRGTNRFYIWDDITGNPREWFTDQFAANSYRADMGYTMALNGSSTDCNILVTGRHYNSGGAGSSDGSVRMNYFTIVGGNKPSRLYFGNTLSKDAIYYTHTIGEDMYLSVSPHGDGRFMMDAGNVVPSEFQINAHKEDVTILERINATTLPAKYNGATYLTINGMHFMVAPYADASGKVAGVKVLDLRNGLAAATVMETLNIPAPITATATATAVKVDGKELDIALVVDADIYYFDTNIKLSVTYELNGGQYNQYGWESKGDICLALEADYNATYGTNKDWVQKVDGVIQYNINGTWMTEEEAMGQDATVAGFIQASTYNTTDNLKNLIETTMVDKYGWLEDVFEANRTAQSMTATLDEALYRKELSAFFLHSPANTSWPATSSYEEAGDLITYQAYWSQTFPNPTQPKDEVVLNKPNRKGYRFDGWYTTADFSGAAVTSVDEYTDGTLYAKWIEHFHTREVPAGYYATVCLPYNLIDVDGAILYEVAGKDNGKVYLDEVPASETEAGKPYIFFTEADTQVFYYGDDETMIAGNQKSLYGTFVKLQDAELEGMYMLQSNKVVKCAATGCWIDPYRAYFNGTELEALGKPGAQMPGRRRVSLGATEENTTTGSEDIVTPNEQVIKVIENGQVIIIRDGVKYNVQGVRF